MIKFILKTWLRQKERLILLLIGVLTVSCGLSFLFNISETNKGTVVNTLQKSWSTTYDILVRPPNSLSPIIKEKELLEPNFLSNIQSGISMEQYEQIKQMDGIDVAAPIAMIGYTGLSIQYNKNVENAVTKPGIYKKTDIKSLDNSYQTNTYFTVGNDYYINKRLNANPLRNGLYSNSTQLLVGVDPAEEAKLVGLDEALAEFGDNQYFTNEDDAFGSNGKYTIPLLINPEPINNMKYQSKVEKVNISAKEIQKLRSMNKDERTSYLEKVPKTQVFSYAASGEQMTDIVFSDTEGINPFSGEQLSNTIGSFVPKTVMFYKTSPINYHNTKSPFKERWKYGFQVKEQHLNGKAEGNFPNNTFRKLNALPVKVRVTINYNILGFFDSSQLRISKDPLSELPMETYRPPSAKFVLDGENNPINPPEKITSSGTPVGLLTEAPTLITTIKAAALIGDKKPVSAIRIRVADVQDINENSQKKIKAVAAKIEKETGLETDITKGSSPQPVLIHVQGNEHDMGWMEQTWIHFGSAYTIFKETAMGFSGIIASVVAVAIIFIIATNLVSTLARKKEFAILLSLGWKTRDLFLLILIEAGILSGISVILIWGTSGISYEMGHDVSLIKLLRASLIVVSIHFIGALISRRMIQQITPYETIHTGESSTKGKRFFKSNNLVKMVLNHVFGKFQRNLLSILAIAFPTALMSFFLFITFRLQGVMNSTWLGEFLVMKIGHNHYIAIGIACIIATLTSTEITWQNVVERKKEFSLLMALGWQRSSLKGLILLEGMVIGLLGGIIGIFLSLLLILFIYGKLSGNDFLFTLVTALIPILIGFTGAIIPTRFLAKINPYTGLK